LGYPLLVESNAVEPLCIAAESWGAPQRLFEAPPLHLTIHVNKGDPSAAEPAYQASADGFSLVCDPSNRAEFSIRAHAACLHISRAVLDRPEWFRHHLLECLVLTALDTVYFVGMHAACVVPPGNRKPGVLLCGVSGSGKSTLAYACARVGWVFVSDDSHLAPDARNTVIGSSRGIRLREPARELFPELRSSPTVIAPNGKQCIEVSLKDAVSQSDSASARHCVFLSRKPGQAAIRPYPEDHAVEYFMGYNTRFDRSGAERRLKDFVLGGTWLLEYDRLEDAIELLSGLA
jgi:hypothetical protein